MVQRPFDGDTALSCPRKFPTRRDRDKRGMWSVPSSSRVAWYLVTEPCGLWNTGREESGCGAGHKLPKKANPNLRTKLTWVRSESIPRDTTSAPDLEGDQTLTLVTGNLSELRRLACGALVNGRKCSFQDCSSKKLLTSNPK